MVQKNRFCRNIRSSGNPASKMTRQLRHWINYPSVLYSKLPGGFMTDSAFPLFKGTGTSEEVELETP